MLQLIESGELNGLPADVFVRGFIRSYARTLGISHEEPLGLFDRAVETRRLADEAKFTQPQLPALDDEAAQSRKGRGLAVFVIIVLVIATITWSLFLRQPPQSGESLSIGPAPGSAPAATG